MGWFYMIPYTVLWVVFHGLVSRGPSNSVADPFLQMVGGGGGARSSNPEIGGGVSKNFFFGPQFGVKIRLRPGPLRPLLWIRH